MKQFWILVGASLFSGLGASAVAFVGHQIHRDLAGHLQRVDDNEDRSKTNREVIVQMVRNAEEELTINPDRLADELDPDHD
ncbi:hypothetical protein [Halosimplex amylolyticum]|uniref:hypothetical protein n=1 Tax=Halosimplex amylolyticum TaxID=3396616 RepID=UPI003F572DA3